MLTRPRSSPRLARVSLARLMASASGNALVEFGLILPVIVLLAIGAYDYGSAYVESQRLTGAARAGTQEALYEPLDWDNTDRIKGAALDEYAGRALSADEISGFPVAANATAYCACADGITTACSTTCGGGSAPARFVQVTLDRAVELTMPYPWDADRTLSLRGEATVRVH